MTKQELNKLVGQYEPLINKITAQMVKSSKYAWAEVKSMAYEGFAIALNNYDSEKSDMDFTQYAAYSIRNNILNMLVQEMHTVKFGYYSRSEGKSIQMIRVDAPLDEENTQAREMLYNMSTEDKNYGEGIEYLLKKLSNKFSQRDLEVFASFYGLREEELKGKELAAKYGISPAYVTLKNKDIIKAIKQDEELLDIVKDYFGI